MSWVLVAIIAGNLWMEPNFQLYETCHKAASDIQILSPGARAFCIRKD